VLGPETREAEMRLPDLGLERVSKRFTGPIIKQSRIVQLVFDILSIIA
jgi:hypothetical protein